jgi:hypothetical protein
LELARFERSVHQAQARGHDRGLAHTILIEM